MKKSLNQLIWEAKKSGKPVNPWAVCTSSVGREDKAKYERCVKDVKKKSPIKEDRINEVGGYDDPNIYAKHAGGYMGNVKGNYNVIVGALKSIENVYSDILDDSFRKQVEDFLKSMDNPLTQLRKSLIDVEKRHLGNLRGGKPTPRDIDDDGE